jgi:hypothetical protein
MMTMLPKKENPSSAVETIKNIISLVATCVGLVVIIIGLRYAMDIFQLIFSILKSPTYLTEPIRQMAEVIGGSALDLSWEGRAVFLANIIALIVYCCGILLCAWLTMALMHTGAKIISLSTGDRSAVKKLLQSAFGNSLQPKATTGKDNITSRNTSQLKS